MNAQHMNTQHTPGPWAIVENQAPHYLDDYRLIVAGKGYFSFANQDSGFGLSGYISHADAHLISTAPDLLAALENLLKLHDDCGMDSPEGKAAKAAIIKAKGEA